MANVTKKRITKAQQFTSPYGNKFAQSFNFTTNASGVLVDSDQATAVAVNDVVRIGVLPAGLELHDALAIVSDAFAATTTADIGFLYTDGADSSAVPQDAAYFFAALNTAATGRTRATAAKAPVRLPKDAYLVMTRKGAADSAVGILDVVVEGILQGPM